ncbi:hypothetical protein NFIA_077920 [Paecilomyces variotii No. 5]|uniref:Uncharacterized protein n=1 Tax=Byssochlamys spectabilis (strain No. 5 / NBRC 109023) TaxID=1356009 RepID=V5I4K6_BYSSN|nr:hypothetical protein NFIA_077920 [Paecilomyces variotii No. 5]
MAISRNGHISLTPTTTTTTRSARTSSTTLTHHPPVPHPILIPLIPSLALLAASLLIVYLNWDSIRDFLSCWGGTADENGYQQVRHADGDECDGEDVYGAPKTGKKQHMRKKTGEIRRRSGLRSRPRPGDGDDTKNEEIEMRPLMRDEREGSITRPSSSRMHQKQRDDREGEEDWELFCVSSGSSSAYTPSESDGDNVDANVDAEVDYDEGNPHHESTDTLSLSKYFDPQTHGLRPEYKNPPSPVTEAWEIELRHRIREGGSVAAWVDHVVDSAAEWWEGIST